MGGAGRRRVRSPLGERRRRAARERRRIGRRPRRVRIRRGGDRVSADRPRRRRPSRNAREAAERGCGGPVAGRPGGRNPPRGAYQTRRATTSAGSRRLQRRHARIPRQTRRLERSRKSRQCAHGRDRGTVARGAARRARRGVPRGMGFGTRLGKERARFRAGSSALDDSRVVAPGGRKPAICADASSRAAFGPAWGHVAPAPRAARARAQARSRRVAPLRPRWMPDARAFAHRLARDPRLCPFDSANRACRSRDAATVARDRLLRAARRGAPACLSSAERGRARDRGAAASGRRNAAAHFETLQGEGVVTGGESGRCAAARRGRAGRLGGRSRAGEGRKGRASGCSGTGRGGNASGEWDAVGGAFAAAGRKSRVTPS